MNSLTGFGKFGSRPNLNTVDVVSCSQLEAPPIESCPMNFVPKFVLIRKWPDGKDSQGEEERKEDGFPPILNLLISFSPCSIPFPGGN
jgi:hypothetical protein